ncbi:hypothetical protein BASA50_004834 [Batrachochytrium salamandrivorans]|uniref:Alpha-ketoglutarate-dependent dioxygenase AlkB-like domain-containing protein n=1 Tax=Batrachochytrium salamandrivorans TaxID=1357716 RepID=A0ABQ8FEH6_9FUNG|nr:hypothetical protein BASA50_004834 [Batrachochytrium salamandrivorans]
MPRSVMMNCLHRTKTTATSQSMMAPTPATPEYLTYRQTHISRRAYSAEASYSNPHKDLLMYIEQGPHKELPSPLAINIIPNFITHAEQEFLEQQITKKLRRLFGREGYREAHTDHVITGYKEAVVSAWASSPEPSTAAVAAAAAAATVQDETDVVTILERAKAAMSAWLGPSRQVKWSPPHLLDMRDGHSGIRAHVDYVEASGSVIGGLCLLSPAVVVFRNQNDPERDYFKALLPARCLYMQADNLRYNYSHEIPMTDSPDHSFKGSFVERHRRISVMFRDKIIITSK